jgi:hypothetical protein
MNILQLRWQFYLGLTLALTFFCASCTDEDDDRDHTGKTNYSASEEFRFAFDPTNLIRLSLEAISGEITIQGVPNSLLDSIFVQGERRVESESAADAEEHLQYLHVLTNVSEHVLNVRTDQPEHAEGRNYIVEYHIEVPEDFPLTVSQVNGFVRIDEMNADVTASTVNGDMRLGGSGIAIANVVNGYLNIESHRGNTEGTVVNGGIHAEVLLPPQGICVLSITNGNIDLQIPDTTSAHLNANVVNGGIEVRDIPFTSGIVGPDRINAVFGDGDGAITLDAVNGNILVRPFGI